MSAAFQFFQSEVTFITFRAWRNPPLRNRTRETRGNKEREKYINGINLAFLLSKYLIIDGYKGFADLNRLNRYGGEFVRKIAEGGGVTYLPQ